MDKKEECIEYVSPEIEVIYLDYKGVVITSCGGPTTFEGESYCGNDNNG